MNSNVLVRKRYRPSAASPVEDDDALGTRPVRVDELRDALRDGRSPPNRLVRRYCTVVYAKTGSYQETVERPTSGPGPAIPLTR